MRKDKVCAHLHYSIHSIHYASQDRKLVHTHTNTNQYVNIKMVYSAMETKGHTQTAVTANRPDIKIKNKTKKTRILTDMLIIADRSAVQK